MPNTQQLEDLAKSLTDTFNTNYQLTKWQLLDRLSIIIADWMSTLIITLIAIIGLLFASVAAAIYLSACVGNYYTGFGMVAFSYLVVAGVLYLARKRLLKQPICNTIIAKNFSPITP